MTNFLKYSLLTISILFGGSISAQTYDGIKGYSNYQKQDKSFISPKVRAKHSISIGIVTGNNSPFQKDDQSYAETGFHLGYNYLILGQKKKIKKKNDKVKTRDFVKASIGFHAEVFNGGGILLNAKYYYPILRVKGLLLTYSFLSEYGLGVHKLPLILNDNQLKFNFALEIIRIRFYKTPLFLHFNTNYDLSNNFLTTDRKNLQFMGGLRFYLYKYKYR